MTMFLRGTTMPLPPFLRAHPVPLNCALLMLLPLLCSAYFVTDAHSYCVTCVVRARRV
eukprot:gene8378-21628_t